MGLIHEGFLLVRGLFANRIGLVAENLALRQQLAMMRRAGKRPRLRPRDRVIWVWLARLWSDWRLALVIVQPETVVGDYLRRRIKDLEIEEMISAPHSPWQNPCVQRLIGSIRRECLNQVIVLNESHLIRILTAYFNYYHSSRTHLSLDRNSTFPRKPEPPEPGPVRAIPQVGGLHHRNSRAA